MSAEIKVFARSVPAIALVLGFLLLISGFTTGNEEMRSVGWTFVIIGFVLQVFWLFRRRRIE
jgi:hypothetical protein